jgi:beta-galactosidase GanA
MDENIWTSISRDTTKDYQQAGGFNTFSIYGNWGWHSPADGVLDFETGAHNFERIFEIAKELGLYVIFRPGPYVNAEANAGGFPGWLTTGEYGTLRNNDSRYTAAWEPYMQKMSEVVLPHTVTNGGNVILYQLENEYGNQWINRTAKTPNATAIDYMELLEASVRTSSIDIPTLHNNPNLNSKSWSQDYDTVGAGGNVDIYSVDNYPSCWSTNTAQHPGRVPGRQLQPLERAGWRLRQQHRTELGQCLLPQQFEQQSYWYVQYLRCELNSTGDCVRA